MVQMINYFCRFDPVDDALNIITVSVQGWEADLIQRSVTLLRTKKAT